MVRLFPSSAARALLLWTLVIAWLGGFVNAAHAEAAAPHGVAVVLVGDAALGPITYALAKQVYFSNVLRPAGITEPRARSLLGLPHDPSPDARELDELRVGVRDEGAVSRRVLAGIATTAHAEALAVVRSSQTEGHVQIRLYLAADSTFDVSLYDGDPADAAWRTEVVRALERRFSATGMASTPATVVAKAPPKQAERGGPRPFYKSPWFWGAVGAAVAIGGTALLVSSLKSNEDIRVHVEPPAGVATSALHTFTLGSFSP